MISSIASDRKKKSYRILEGSIGYVSFGFLFLLAFLSFFESTRLFVSIFLIIYSFLWVLKFSLNATYVIYSFKQFHRWETFNFKLFFKNNAISLDLAKKQLLDFKKKYASKFDWSDKIQEDISSLENIQSTKFANLNNVFHINIFSVYNESPEILIRSLDNIYNSEYDRKNLVVLVSQEARFGSQKNKVFRNRVLEEKWISGNYISENNLDIVYSDQHASKEFLSSYKAQIFNNVKWEEGKLTVVFTEHPDGLPGEVVGKASNEDWGGRQASLFVQARDIDPDMVLVTSLDADSHVGKYFYHNLSYRFCLTPDRLHSGFQPVHVYSNNFFKTGLWPRQVAAQTTLHNLAQLSIEGETSFFAIYSVPLGVLRYVNFWVREVIAEDSMLFTKCLVYFQGNFKIYPFYGVFEGDAVEADDYIDAILNQYKQLQRWAWGGVEGFPYLFKKFFLEPEGKNTDIRLRIKWALISFSNHFFWSSTPMLFSFGVIIPQIVGGEKFRSGPVAQNLSIFSQYFTWISFIFLVIFSYITITFVGVRASKHHKVNWYNWALVLVQCIVSPIIYFLMGFPGLDAQWRGITGKYLTYSVTPKK